MAMRRVKKKWLIYDGNFDYEVGDFDGKQFTPEQPVQNHKLGHWNAAQTFNNSPDGRTVIMGWLVQAGFYKKKMPFAEQLTFPATMELRNRNSPTARWFSPPIRPHRGGYPIRWRLTASPAGSAGCSQPRKRQMTLHQSMSGKFQTTASASGALPQKLAGHSITTGTPALTFTPRESKRRPLKLS